MADLSLYFLKFEIIYPLSNGTISLNTSLPFSITFTARERSTKASAHHNEVGC